jgi:hypothetical protein
MCLQPLHAMTLEKDDHIIINSDIVSLCVSSNRPSDNYVTTNTVFNLEPPHIEWILSLFLTGYGQRRRTSFFNTCVKNNFGFWPINVKISLKHAYFPIYYIHDKITAIWLVKRSAIISLIALWGEREIKTTKLQYSSEIYLV